MGKTLQIIHFNRVFHYFHHPFWGFSPIFGNIHISIFRCKLAVSFRESNPSAKNYVILVVTGEAMGGTPKLVADSLATALLGYWGTSQIIPSLKWGDPWKRRFLLETILFRGKLAVSFRDGISWVLINHWNGA